MTDQNEEHHTHRWTSGTDLVRHATGERITDGEAFSPTDTERRTWPGRIEELEEVADGDTCTAVIESGEREGEICGRSLPCRFHSDTSSQEE